MDLLTQENLETLMEQQNDVLVSIFMPTHRAGPDIQQDPIRLKNLLNAAKEKLMAAGLGSAAAEDFLEPARQFLDDTVFWRHQSDGLAIFIGPEFFAHYRLPLEFEELVVAANRFHIKPLLSWFSKDGQFYLLALSQNQVKLFRGSRYRIDELALEDVPLSLDEALKYDEISKQQQYHTKTAQSGGSRSAIFHGQGAGKEANNEQLFRFFRQINNGLQQQLEDMSMPLILACVEYLFPIYKKASTYPNLFEQNVEGNPESLHPKELHQRAWKLLKPYFEQDQKESMTQFQNLVSTEQASKDIRRIVPAAYSGKIDTLFVALNRQQWGQFDRQTNTLNLHASAKSGDRDLLDTAAVQTLKHSGTVFALSASKMPSNVPLAAIFRY